MSRFFGDLIQVGYVVRDLEDVMAYWATHLGIGPWFFLPHLAVPDFVYYGQPSAVDISLALANSGSVQIELIQQHNEAPSMYKQFLDAGPVPIRESGGVQHLGYGTHDFPGAMDKALAAGYVVAQQGTGGSRGPFAYLCTEWHRGTVIELMDMAHGRAELFAGIAAAAREWDGTDPVRIRLPI